MNDNPSFNEWFNENKDGDYLKSSYQQYCLEMQQMGVEKAKSYQAWAREYYQED